MKKVAKTVASTQTTVGQKTPLTKVKLEVKEKADTKVEVKTQTAATVKEEVLKTETAVKKDVEVKEAAKEIQPKTEENKTVKAATVKKTTKPVVKAEKEEKVKMNEAAVKTILQFAGKSYDEADFQKMATDVWVYDLGNKKEDIQNLALYVKPEEDRVYFVFNEEITGSFAI